MTARFRETSARFAADIVESEGFAGKRTEEELMTMVGPCADGMVLRQRGLVCLGR